MARRRLPPDAVGAPLTRAELLTCVTRAQLAGPSFRRLTRGVHVSSCTLVDHGVRARGALLAVRGRAVLGGLSAAWAYGVREAGDDDPVLLLAPRPAPRCRTGVVVRQCTLDPGDVVTTRLGRVTSPARTVVDLLRTLDMPRALCAAEAVAHRTRLTRAHVDAELHRQRGARGLAAARRRARQLEPMAESYRETLLRLVVAEAGLPPCVVQHEVHDEEALFVARLDLAWPAVRVALEYDGDHHRDRAQHSADLARHNRLRRLGWTVLQVDARMLEDPRELLHQLRQLLESDGAQD
ncbi:endonuclease domain-containing protein [Pseudokineococcus sp. 1T1Z-3]|uniref:endonuclease domain-containing protein n=1 Tax=Pseudokineococcus sp. 1T1Z-3 TaxID=3132745 RepID=UPI0030B128F7